MNPSGEYTSKEIIPMLTDFCIESDAGIETAAVIFSAKIYNYFERIEFISARVQSIYRKNGDQIEMRELSGNDFQCISEFMDSLPDEFERKCDNWILGLKESHEEYLEENMVNENR